MWFFELLSWDYFHVNVDPVGKHYNLQWESWTAVRWIKLQVAAAQLFQFCNDRMEYKWEQIRVLK